jgi:hypothetical protein
MQVVVLTGNKSRSYIDELANLKGMKTGIIAKPVIFHKSKAAIQI